MISRRKFFSIFIMMFVLLLLFQFSMVFRDRENKYDENSNLNLSAKKVTSQNAWKQSEEKTDLSQVKEEKSVVFIGESTSSMEAQVERWAGYVKWDMFTCKSLNQYIAKKGKTPQMMVIESEKYITKKNLNNLKKMQKKGATIVIGSLEDTKRISKDEALMDFLGIQKVVSQEVKVEGAKLFEGLLLGGEGVYKTPEEKEEKYRQDLDLKVPWYQVAAGTKTYMVGLLDEKKWKKVKNEELPTLIWRNGLHKKGIYSIVGDYMKDSTALGILDGIVTEDSEYNLYPVVNAQNISIINFPEFADENEEEMQKLYSRSVTGIGRDIIWPALISIVEHANMKMTCFFQPQSDYTDGIEPNSKTLTFYLKQLKEQNAEAGWSMQYKSMDSLEQKVKSDDDFLKKSGSNYQYGAIIVDDENMREVINRPGTKIFENISTLLCEYTEEKPIVSYCANSKTLQMITSDGMNYTYRSDIRMKSIQSALGYSNVMLNLQTIFWPTEKTDRWQKMQERFSGNLLSYWKDFSTFTATTASESDQRARTFLNLSYDFSQKDQEITLKTSETGSWFLLRTHGEEIKKIIGGKQEKIEDNAYLIYAEEKNVKIQMKGDSLYYYADKQTHEN